MTYIDEIMNKEKRNHTPAPGQYTASSASVPSLKRKHVKEQKQTDRMTYLDGVQFNANNTPGVGSYNPVSRVLRSIYSL